DRPCRRNSIVMAQLAEILLAQAIECCTEHFGRAADEIMHLGLKRPAVAVVPCLGRDIAVLPEDSRRIPVQRLTFEPVAALEDEDDLSRGRQMPCKRAAAGAAADDNNIEMFIHSGSNSLQADTALHKATVREDAGGGEIARAVAGKESDHARDLLGARHAPERNGGIELLELGGVFHSGKIDGRRYRARSHADDQDIVRRELDSGRAREHPHTALRETISRIAGHRPVLMDRTDIDNAAAIALLDHLFGSDLS